jgi:hypothetical protein
MWEPIAIRRRVARTEIRTGVALKMSDKARNIRIGGACAYQLPPDPRCAGLARSLLSATMASLGLPPGVTENGMLAVSELATNAYRHAVDHGQAKAGVPELWIWARTVPAPQLIVSVFDTDRDVVPDTACTDPLDEHGRGLHLVASVTADWGVRSSRCRLGLRPVTGKSVWCALELPESWPEAGRIIAPHEAAHRLLMALGARGVEGTCRSDDHGISVIQLDNLNIWVKPNCFSWSDGNGGYTRLPLIDLQETVERVLQQVEEVAKPPSPPNFGRFTAKM